jgi:mannosyltransferase OCH1-like enzyme
MLNRKKIAEFYLFSEKLRITIMIIEHPGWYEIIRKTKSKILSHKHFPFCCLAGKESQKIVKKFIHQYINKKCSRGYLLIQTKIKSDFFVMI